MLSTRALTNINSAGRLTLPRTRPTRAHALRARAPVTCMAVDTRPANYRRSASPRPMRRPSKPAFRSDGRDRSSYGGSVSTGSDAPSWSSPAQPRAEPEANYGSTSWSAPSTGAEQSPSYRRSSSPRRMPRKQPPAFPSHVASYSSSSSSADTAIQSSYDSAAVPSWSSAASTSRSDPTGDRLAAAAERVAAAAEKFAAAAERFEMGVQLLKSAMEAPTTHR